jgi:3-oxoacyl-[acyl-carrier-protein] synthase II
VSGGRATREPAAVLGVGVCTPGGNTPDELWASLLASRWTAEPFVDERLAAGADILVSRVTDFDPRSYLNGVEVRRLDRSHHLAVAAAHDAIDALGDVRPPPERCAVVCGIGFGATATYEAQHMLLLDRGSRALSPLVIPMLMPNAAAAHLALRFGFKGPSLTVSSACASGATAIGEGLELLRRGAADLVLAGGVESMLTYNALCGFLRLDVMSRNVGNPGLASRPFDEDRDGFVMGEGAGFVVMVRASDAPSMPMATLGFVSGYGSNADAFHLVAPSPDGEGARRCMRLALDDAGVGPDDVNHVNAHGTATILNDLAESTALTTLFEGLTPPVTAVKGCTGHMIAGSGAVEAIVTLWSLRHRLVPPVAGLVHVDPKVEIDVVIDQPRAISDGYGLSNSFGFGGVNAVLVLAGPPNAE